MGVIHEGVQLAEGRRHHHRLLGLHQSYAMINNQSVTSLEHRVHREARLVAAVRAGLPLECPSAVTHCAVSEDEEVVYAGRQAAELIVTAGLRKPGRPQGEHHGLSLLSQRETCDPACQPNAQHDSRVWL